VVTPAEPVQARPEHRVLPPHPLAAAATMLLFTFLLYVVEVYDLATDLRLDSEDGIVAGDPAHLDGLLWAPLLHAGWGHLAANTPFFLLFGFLVLAGGVGQFVLVTAVVWLSSGLGAWLFSPPETVVVGASGVIFGWLLFLLFRGFFAGSAKQILLAVVLFLLWGGVLFEVLPGRPGVSWQAHLFGALGGVVAAWLVAERRPRGRPVVSR
jgi:membrane associated rhomboid family serine protease